MDVYRSGAHPVTDKRGMLGGMVGVVVMLQRIFFRPNRHEAE